MDENGNAVSDVKVTYTVDDVTEAHPIVVTAGNGNLGSETITNREKDKLTVKKVWIDGQDHSSSPDKIQFHLYRRQIGTTDWQTYKEWQELKPGEGWEKNYSGLEEGYEYKVEEQNPSSDYTVTYSTDGDNWAKSGDTIVINNTKKTTGIAVHKVWDLADGEEVPDSVTVQLMKAGEKTDPDALHVKYYLYQSGEGWKNTGTEHTLVIKNGTSFEISQGGLTGDYLIDSGSGTVTYNQGKVTVSNASDGLIIGIKTGWDSSGESVNSTSAVSPDINTGSPVEGKTVTLTAPNWYGEWTDLDDGYYYITETKVGDTELSSSGYEVTYTNNDGIKTGTITATNTKTEPQTGKIIVKKTFKGVTGDDLTALQNGLTITVAGKDVGGTGINSLELHWSDVQGEGKTIDNLPLNEKYQITESITGDAATTVLAKYEQVTKGTNASVTSFTDVEPTADGVTKELVNSYEPKTTDFEFSKIWKNIGNNPTTWPESTTITVTLNAYTNDVSKKEINDMTVELSANGSAAGVTPVWTAMTSAEGTVTTFKVEGLQKYKDGKELHYYVIETQVDGYKAPSYATSEGKGLVFTGSDVPKATDGQQIINTPEGGYELPSTGGIGTTLFTALGGLMTATAGAILTMKSYRRRKENA